MSEENFQNDSDQNQGGHVSEEKPSSQPAEAGQGITEKKMLSSISVLWNKSITLYKKNFWKMIGMVLLPLVGVAALFVVLLLFGALGLLGGLGSGAGVALKLILGLLGLIAVLGIIYLGVIAKAGVYILTMESDNNPTFKEAFKKSKKVAIGVFVVNIMAGVFVMLWGFLFIIPGIIAAVYYSLAIWTYLYEGFTSTKALKRSKELVKGYWWAVVGRFLAIFGTYYALVIIIQTLLGENSVAGNLFAFVVQIASIVIGPLMVIYSCFIYWDLRNIKGESKIENKKGAGSWIVVLILLVFILILPTMAIVSLNNARERASEKMFSSKEQSMQTCIEMYKAEKGEYPVSLKDLEEFSYCKLMGITDFENYNYKQIENDDYELCDIPPADSKFLSSCVYGKKFKK